MRGEGHERKLVSELYTVGHKATAAAARETAAAATAVAATAKEAAAEQHGHLRLRRRHTGPERPRPRERARASGGGSRRRGSLGDRRPSIRAARALAVRAPAAVASAAAAERGGVEGEAIQRAVVGRGSAPMGSACSHSSRGAHLQPEAGRGTRGCWPWVALERALTRGSAHQKGGASVSPRWSGRAAGSRRAAWRLGGRWGRRFPESPTQ